MIPRSRSLRTRAFLAFGGLFAVTLAAIEFSTLYGVPWLQSPGVYQSTLVNELKHLDAAADVKRRLVENWLREQRNLSSTLATTFVLREFLRWHAAQPIERAAGGEALRHLQPAPYRILMERLETLAEIHQARALIVYDKARAEVLAATGIDPEAGIVLAPGSGMLGKLEDVGQGEIVIEVARPAGGVPGLVLAQPLQIPAQAGERNEGRYLFILVIDMEAALSPIVGRGQDMLLGGGSEAMLIAEDMRPLLPPRETPSGWHPGDALPAVQSNQVEALALSGGEGAVTAPDYRGVPVLAAYRHIRVTPEIGWGLVIKRDEAEVLDQLYHGLYRYLALDVVVLLILLGVIAWLAGRLTRPLSGLAEAARRIEAGDLDARAPLVGRDMEMRGLSRTFNAMADRVRQWHADFNAELEARTRELKERERLLHNILDNLPVGLWLLDRQGMIIEGNPAALSLWGGARYVEPGEFGAYRAWRPGETTPLRAEEWAAARAIRDGAVTLDEELEIESFDGSRKTILASAIPLLDEAHRPTGVIVVNQDITGQKLFERSLAQARDASEAANRAKSAFLANMSHELRTPLNSILGYAQILAQDPALGGAARDKLDMIRGSGEFLLVLINDILDLSRIEAGKLELNVGEMALRAFLQDIVAPFRMRAEQNGLALRFESDPGLPFSIRADEKRLRQVVMNLMGNAVKFTQRGWVVLRARMNGEYLRVEVEDSGRGIAEADLEAIFEPFRQSGDQLHMEGTGLGLPICRRLVTLMNGELHVRSRLGEGSLFWFEIPVEVLQWEGADGPAAVRPERRVIGYVGRRLRILIVDDLPTNRLILRDFLQPLGFELFQAGDGQEALEMAQRCLPDIVFMDLRMPRLDGFEATRRLRADARFREIPIIALSASVFAEQQAQAHSAGCTSFLAKPFRVDDLIATLAEHAGVEWQRVEEAETRTAAGAPLLAPDPEILADLLGLARGGRLEELGRRLDTLAADPALAVFRTAALERVKQFQMKELIRFLEALQTGR